MEQLSSCAHQTTLPLSFKHLVPMAIDYAYSSFNRCNRVTAGRGLSDEWRCSYRLLLLHAAVSLLRKSALNRWKNTCGPNNKIRCPQSEKTRRISPPHHNERKNRNATSKKTNTPTPNSCLTKMTWLDDPAMLAMFPPSIRMS